MNKAITWTENMNRMFKFAESSLIGIIVTINYLTSKLVAS